MRPLRWQPTRLPCPRDSPGKNTGVGCHFLLQCMKVKSESEVTQSCPTLSDPIDRSLPGSSVHGIFQARVLEWVAISFSRGSSRPRDRTRVSHIPGTLTSEPPATPLSVYLPNFPRSRHTPRVRGKAREFMPTYLFLAFNASSFCRDVSSSSKSG